MGNVEEMRTFWSRLDKSISEREEWQSLGRTVDKFFSQCEQIARIILRIFALALKQKMDYFDPLLSQQCHTLRLLHYPPLSTDTAMAAEASGEQSESEFLCIEKHMNVYYKI